VQQAQLQALERERQVLQRVQALEREQQVPELQAQQRVQVLLEQ
jgi:hypothetical protein